MKITAIEAIILRVPALDSAIADGSQDDLLIKVHTDDGVVGIGEVDSAPEAVKAVVDARASHAVALSLSDLLVGEDPLDVERLWSRMYRGLIYIGRRGISLHALSGVDIALWDIKGKVAGRPVCELLGPRRHERVRAYASMLMAETPDEVRRDVERVCTLGFTAIKLGWGPLGKDPDLDVELVRAAREAAGERDIMIDAGLGYGSDVATAARVARQLERLGVSWLEEPFEPDQYEAYAELADLVELPIAAGEQDGTFWGFRELIDRAHVDIVQPDVTRCGGITEAVRILELANRRNVKAVPHAWKSGIIKAASLHVNAVNPSTPLQEYCVSRSPLNTELTLERFPLDDDGFVAVPDRPGLGVTLDEDVVARYRIGA